MNIVIRQERPEDYRKVEEVTREAFWNLYVPGCNEHVILHKMRKNEEYIPELSFVIEVEGEIVGSIHFTESKIVSEEQKEYKTITFGPVSILPSMHRKGLGRRLISYAIEEAKKLGYRAIVILGYPYHYEPYGFVGGKQYGISMPDGKYYKGLLVLPLYEGALNQISGSAMFSDAFGVNEEEVETYDQTFSLKEKRIQDSQAEFEQAVALLDE